MRGEERLRLRICELAHEQVVTTGVAQLNVYKVQGIGAEEDVDPRQVLHVLQLLVNEGLLTTSNAHSFMGGAAIAVEYELTFNARVHAEANRLRRELLQIAATAYHDSTERLTLTRDDRGPFQEHDWGQLYGAAVVLEFLGLIVENRSIGAIKPIATAQGFDVARDPEQMKIVLPVSETEMEAAHAQVAADALSAVIRTCEQLLKERGWTDALEELERGDRELDDGDWINAVREYYSAVESGLRYRLSELGEKPSAGAALRDLSKHASAADAIPRNYQAPFDYLDSIRSPRSHGAGGAPNTVEVGPAEALLMGNLARSLLLYLGQRPR